MASDEARAQFLVEPYNYVSNIQIPPLRLVFLGPTGAGKTTYIKELKSFGAIHINYSDYLIEFANKPLLSQSLKEEIMHEINNEIGNLSKSATLEVLQSLFKLEVSSSLTKG